MRRSHDGIILTISPVARLVVQVRGRYYFFLFFMLDSIITLPSNENSQISLKERT